MSKRIVSVSKGRRRRLVYKLVLWKLRVLCVSAVVLSAFLCYFILKKPQYAFYATSSQGKNWVLKSIARPVFGDNQVIRWSESVVRRMFSMDFNSYNQVSLSLKKDFTPQGYAAYTQSFDNSGFRSAVIDSKLLLSSFISQAPVILMSGRRDGVYTWVISLPVMVNKETTPVVTTQNLNVLLYIEQVSVLDAPKGGLQISNIAVSSAG